MNFSSNGNISIKRLGENPYNTKITQNRPRHTSTMSYAVQVRSGQSAHSQQAVVGHAGSSVRDWKKNGGGSKGVERLH